MNIKGTLSDTQEISFGVPPWDDLVPLYIKYININIQHFSLLHHSYADDLQLYTAIKKKDSSSDKVSEIENCVS